MEQRIRWVRRALGLCVLGLGLGAALSFPSSAQLAPGWFTPIIALELAREAADVAFLAGPENEDLRAAMDRGHRVDLWFPMAYGAFLAATAWELGGRWRGVLCGLALLAIPLDLVENAVLTGMIQQLRAGELPTGFGALFAATWTKWGCIAAALSGLGWSVRGKRPLTGRLAAFPVVVAPLAVLTALPLLGELMAIAVMVGFVAWIVESWRAPPPEETA